MLTNDFVKVTEISIVRSGSGSGLIDYWTESIAVINLAHVIKANRHRQSRIKGTDVHFTTITFQNGITISVLESLATIFIKDEGQ